MDSAAREVWAVRQLLDHQLVDRHDTNCGKIDDLAFGTDDEELPVLDSVLTGLAALLYRFSQNAAGDPRSISWSRVSDVAVEVRLALDVDETPTAGAESWLSRHVLSHIPGSGIKRGGEDAATE